MYEITPDQRAHAAVVLDAAADLIDSQPGTNVLDALREAHLAHASDDTQIGEVYYLLLDYVPPHVEFLGPWSDSETPDRVAGKLRQLAKTTRKGGPAKITATPAAPIVPEALVAGGRNAGAGKQRHYSREAKLNMQRATARRWLAVQQRKAHPDPHKVTELELRIAEIDRELAALNAGEESPGDAAALALIAESQAFPADRDPTRNGAGRHEELDAEALELVGTHAYQREHGTSMSGL